MAITPNLQSSKTSRDCSRPPKARTSKLSSKPSPTSATIPFLYLNLQKGDGSTPERSWEIITPSRGEFRGRNTGASPKDAIESTLSQILQADAPAKCFLSKRACEGILRRAQRRGKELPPMLKEA